MIVYIFLVEHGEGKLIVEVNIQPTLGFPIEGLFFEVIRVSIKETGRGWMYYAHSRMH